MAPQQPVLLVDFAVYKPPEELKIDYFATQKASRKWQVRTGNPRFQAVYRENYALPQHI